MGTIINSLSNITTILILSFLISSCTSDIAEAPTKPDEINVELTSVEDLNNLSQELQKVIPIEVLSDINSNKKYSLNSAQEKKLKEIFKPLLNTGSTFRKDLIERSSDSEAINGLENLNEIELMFLGMLSAASQGNNTKGKTLVTPRWVNCVASATGITAINTILNTGELYAASTGLQVVKAIGKRYLGYVGLAVAVYNFVECMNKE